MDTSCRGDYSVFHRIILLAINKIKNGVIPFFIFPRSKRGEIANLFLGALDFLNKKRIIELEIESLGSQIGCPIIGRINKLFATHGDWELLFIYGI